jgi:hypothetical protein
MCAEDSRKLSAVQRMPHNLFTFKLLAQKLDGRGAIRFRAMALGQSRCIHFEQYVNLAAATQFYMLISLNGTSYHYCEIGAGTVSFPLIAPSMGQFYNASIKGDFDCRVHRVPDYGGTSTEDRSDRYVPQPGSPGDHFGAIAFSNSSGSIGYSYDHGSGNEAQIVRFKNVAMAARSL